MVRPQRVLHEMGAPNTVIDGDIAAVTLGLKNPLIRRCLRWSRCLMRGPRRPAAEAHTAVTACTAGRRGRDPDHSR